MSSLQQHLTTGSWISTYNIPTTAYLRRSIVPVRFTTFLQYIYLHHLCVNTVLTVTKCDNLFCNISASYWLLITDYYFSFFLFTRIFSDHYCSGSVSRAYVGHTVVTQRNRRSPFPWLNLGCQKNGNMSQTVKCSWRIASTVPYSCNCDNRH